MAAPARLVAADRVAERTVGDKLAAKHEELDDLLLALQPDLKEIRSVKALLRR